MLELGKNVGNASRELKVKIGDKLTIRRVADGKARDDNRSLAAPAQGAR